MIAATRGAIDAPRSRHLLAEPHPAREDVVERQRQLVPDRPGDLGLEERAGRGRAAAAGPAPARAPRRPAPPCRAARRAGRPRRDGRGDPRDRRELGGDPVERVGGRPRRPAGRSAVCARPRSRRLGPSTASIDVASHHPVGRVLAAADPHDAVGARRSPGARATPSRSSRPDGAISGRSPAYVPTTSSRVRSTSIVALTVAEQLVDLPAGGGRMLGGPVVGRVRRADQPVVGPRDEEHDLARAPGSSARPCSGSASRGTTRCAPRLGRMPHRPARERMGGFGGPDAGRVDDGARRGWRTPRRSSTSSDLERLGDPVAGPSRQAGRAHARHGHRARHPRRPRSGRRRACSARRPRRRRGTGGRRASPARPQVAARSRASSAVERRRCQPPSCRAPRMSYSVSPAS